MQEPLAQSEGTVHVLPEAALHWPSASHVIPPVQLSGSCAFVTALHTPGVATGPGEGGPGSSDATWSQAWQAPHVVSQHTPSTQWPVSHCASAVQAAPFEWYSHVSATGVPATSPPKTTTRARFAS
jgi:hypothetical protein